MINKLYKNLLSKFGPQGWWPTSVNGIPTHHGRPPKTQDERFEIITGAILTQNTNWKNVEKALINLNKHNLVNIKKIKNINKNKLAELIRPSGYYNQKAERLKLAAEFFDSEMDTFINDKNTIKLRKKLLALKGIGPETADSILLYAFEKPTFVIDAYTSRITKRLGVRSKDYHDLQSVFTKNLKKDIKIYKEYHALLVELGKNYCKNKPVCYKCPIKRFCKND